MSPLLKAPEKLSRFLASRELAIGLFLILSLLLVPGTLKKDVDTRLDWAGSLVLGVMALNLVLCTTKRIRSLSAPVIIMHLGTILILAGGVIGSFGYVATVNLYEGTSVDMVYRWDLRKDVPLGVTLALKKIHQEYYPVKVQVGVLRGEEKIGLFEIKTGESFRLGEYTVRAESLQLPPVQLLLNVFVGDQFVGSVETDGQKNLSVDFPYDFRLVAYQNPSLKRAGVDLLLLKKSIIIADGKSEVNSPLTWESLRFYNTSAEADEYGQRYAGIEITNDPGRPYVYTGFAVMSVGALLYFWRKIRGYR